MLRLVLQGECSVGMWGSFHNQGNQNSFASITEGILVLPVSAPLFRKSARTNRDQWGDSVGSCRNCAPRPLQLHGCCRGLVPHRWCCQRLLLTKGVQAVQVQTEQVGSSRRIVEGSGLWVAGLARSGDLMGGSARACQHMSKRGLCKQSFQRPPTARVI